MSPCAIGRLGRRELSVLLCTAMLNAAALEWYEIDDIWQHVSQGAPLFTVGAVHGGGSRALPAKRGGPGAGARPRVVITQVHWSEARRCQCPCR